MLKVKKGRVKHRGKATDNLTEFGVLMTWLFAKIVLPTCNGDISKARYRMESFMEDALRIAKKMEGVENGK